MLFLLVAALVLAADSPEVARARLELDHVREQAAAGLVPMARVAEAQQVIDDAVDGEILNQTLYAHLQIEDLSEAQADDMVAAARRRAERTAEKVERGKKLVAAGVAEPYLFAELETELATRREVLKQAEARATVLMEIVGMAHAEASESPIEAAPASRQAEEHVEGDHLLSPKDIRDVTLAYEKQFHEPFPVSARGSTAVHRALGFDHTGRIDVAVTPDSPEGAWLRRYLEAKSIPYYAFRVAIAGKATAPHIHIGPGSTRLHPTG